tara:strand:- start:288 stop:800 length:513 start_codon:yes stop_codon:yes gene_type:complete
LNQELVTYIVLGSYKRLKNLKLPSSNIFEEYLSANFSDESSLEKDLDELIANSKGNLIVLLPPSSFPNVKAKKALKKISMIDLSTWGWFKFNKNNNDVIQNLKKISASIRSIPDIEQGIFFTKRLYFSVGGIGKLGSSPFKEISKRFYSRIDPQNSLPALIIRTKNFNIF